jgi:hypothetical protein
LEAEVMAGEEPEVREVAEEEREEAPRDHK